MSRPEIQKPPFYEPHRGTVRIAGRTIPKQAAYSALVLFRERVDPIDFVAIGANSNNQACKALGIFAYWAACDSRDSGVGVAFIPLRYRTTTRDFHNEEQERDMIVWRTVIASEVGRTMIHSVEHRERNQPTQRKENAIETSDNPGDARGHAEPGDGGDGHHQLFERCDQAPGQDSVAIGGE